MIIKKRIVVPIFFILFGGAFMLLSWVESRSTPNKVSAFSENFKKPDKMEEGLIKIGPYSFRVEFARTLDERRYGLMFRKTLPENTGMIFINEKPQRFSVWMKNTFIPLDVLFFDGNRRVVDIFENLKPLDETPRRSIVPALGMVELPAGTVQKYNIKVGNEVLF